MKAIVLQLWAAVAMVSTAFADDPPPAVAAPAPPPPNKRPGVDATAAPGDGFQAKRYESLWTKSPFAVETPETAEESPDYSLVGVAQLDGIYYATLIQRQNQEHFLLSSDKPVNGLTLTSISRGHDVSDTTASLLKDGQPITLKLEQGAAVAPPPVPNPNAPNIAVPTFNQQNIPMPGATPPASAMPIRPLIRIHRPAIHLPPRNDQPAPAPSTPPPPPGQ